MGRRGRTVVVVLVPRPPKGKSLRQHQLPRAKASCLDKEKRGCCAAENCQLF